MDPGAFIGGCIGGGTGIAVGHPLDTIKVRLQSPTQDGSTVKYKGIIDCCLKIMKQEGVNGFFKGLTSPLLGVSLQNALLFGTQRSISTHFGTDLNAQFYAGCVTGAIVTLVTCPIEFSKIQLQMQGIGEKSITRQKRNFKGPTDVLLKYWKTERMHGVFRGFWITLLRESPGYGVYFYSYEYFCEFFKSRDNSSSTRLWHLLMAGGLTGIIGWGFIYPVDVVKSRIQAEGFKPHGRYLSTLDCVKQLYLSDGIKGFTRGLGTTVLRAFPVNAATLCTVSLIERVLSPSAATSSEKNCLES